VRYRVRHTAARWRAGERPKLIQQILKDDPGVAL
jgi:hypothetical protein